MAKLYNIARMTTGTTGTGTITLGSAVSSYLTFAQAGAQNGDVVTYAIVDGSNREIGRGTYTSSGTTLSRDTVLKSTNSGSKINLTGLAEVFITAAAEDFFDIVQDTTPQLGGALDALGNNITDVGALTADSVQFIGGTGTQGTVTWNTDELTLDIIQGGATLQVGQETQLNCRNNTGSTIANGTPVMATGTLGASGRITIAPMNGTNVANAKYLLGLATEDIANGADGKVTVYGKVRQIDTTNTSLFTGTIASGDVLWIDPNNVGKLTKTEPTGSALNMPVAFVIYAATNGTIMVRVTPINENHYAHLVHTHELTDLAATGATSGYVLTADGSGGATFQKGTTTGKAYAMAILFG